MCFLYSSILLGSAGFRFLPLLSGFDMMYE